MSVNIEKVTKLVGFVDKLIQMKEIENKLDESIISEMIRQALMISEATYTYSDEEIEAARRDITYKYQIFTTPGKIILADYDEDDWYEDAKSDIDPVFWTRYKYYLIDKKHFSPSVVSVLGDDTLDKKLMRYIVNPKAKYPAPILKRGLIIGDVQSGKTSTYIGFISVIDSINGVPYDGVEKKYVRLGLETSQDMRLYSRLKRASFKLLEDFPDAEYFVVTRQTKSKTNLFLGGDVTATAKVKAYRLK